MNDPMNSHQRNDSRNNLFHSSGYGDSITAKEDDTQAKSVKYYVRDSTSMKVSALRTLGVESWLGDITFGKPILSLIWDVVDLF